MMYIFLGEFFIAVFIALNEYGGLCAMFENGNIYSKDFIDRKLGEGRSLARKDLMVFY